MSGICAVLQLDGRAADCGEIGPVLAALAVRGPDRSDVSGDEAAALGHALNGTTPESLVEPMPLRHVETGCIITADVRLDNRETLMSMLGLDAAERVIGDGEIILAAYLRWGMDCPVHLLGDFAFVVWDPRHQRVFAARDKVGMRQLVYCNQPGKLFACATDAEALIRHPRVPARLNEGRIADLIMNLEAIDGVSTFYRDLWQLLPAHCLAVDRGGLKTWRYWKLEPQDIVEQADDRAYEEAFLAVFTEAVGARLRAPEGVLGSMLSGGMDSGSVVAVGSRLLRQAGAPPLRTVSAIDTDPACLETRAVRASLTMEHLDPVLVSVDMPGAFRDALISTVRERAEPFDGHMAMVWAIYLAAHRSGLKVLLDGVCGDTTVSMGNVVKWHVEAGRYRAAWREAQADEACWGDLLPARQMFLGHLRRKFVPPAIRNVWYGLKPLIFPEEEDYSALLRRDFADNVGAAARLAQFHARIDVGYACDPLSRARRVTHPFAVAARERYDRVASRFGIEPRDPFLDPRVQEFVLTLPVEQVKSGGWFKYILRRAMAGYLPDSVRWRTGRTHVGPKFILQCGETLDPASRQDFQDILAPYAESHVLSNWLASDFADSALAQVSEFGYLAQWLIRTKPLLAA